VTAALAVLVGLMAPACVGPLFVASRRARATPVAGRARGELNRSGCCVTRVGL